MKLDSLIVLPCDTHGLYYDRSGRTATTANQLACVDSQIDENAVFSVLQYGAIVPPLSPWKGIHRFSPGYEFHGTKVISPVDIRDKLFNFTEDPENQANKIEEIIDSILQRNIQEQVDDEPILLFSGGVDSGFIASRLAYLGYKKSLLVNFSFGENDQESKLAEEMANKLDLNFERVTATKESCHCLREPGRFYDHPFADHATEPTSELAYTIINYLGNESNRLIIDGIGADGGFGMASKIETWNQIDRIPKLAKNFASYIYKKALWKNKYNFEYYIGLLRRSAEMPILSAIFAQNSLGGVLYNDSPRFSIDQLLDDWVSGWAGDSLALKAVGVNLALKEANIFSHKSLHIFESSGHKVLSPFIEIELVSAGLAYVNYWKKFEPKAPIKKSLSRHIPCNMIYRPKSAFSDPNERIFYSIEFLDYLRSAVASNSPICHLLEKKPIIESCDKLAIGKRLPGQTLNLLWAITFTDRWYRTAQRGRSADRAQDSLSANQPVIQQPVLGGLSNSLAKHSFSHDIYYGFSDSSGGVT